MNITRAQGRAALKRMEELAELGEVFTLPARLTRPLIALGWFASEDGYFNECSVRGYTFLNLNEVLLALAMVVAISGVET